MTKIVYNKCFGGFDLSKEAIELGRDLTGNSKWIHHYIERTDPILIRILEELGSEKASGDYASLAIEELPEGTVYRIDEYDGREIVKTVEDYEWSTA